MSKETSEKEPKQSKMERFIERVKSQLPINIQRLHTECSNQPALYAEVGEAAAEAKLAAKRAKITLEELKATVDAEVRAHPEHFGLEKTTEACISSAVTRSESVQKATQEMMRLDHEAGILGVMLGALEQRRSMLTAEVDLFVASYFTTAAFGEDTATATRKQMKDHHVEGRTKKK